MSRFSPLRIALLIAFFASTGSASAGPDPKKMLKQSRYMEKLYDFMSYVDKGYESVATLAKQLQLCRTQEHRFYASLLKNLNSSVTILKMRQPGCPSRWKKYRSGCFLFKTAVYGDSIKKASNKCAKKNAFLAKCTSREQQDFFARSVDSRVYVMMVGGNDRDTEGT